MNDIDELRTRIHKIRGIQVMLDKDLSELYGVEVKNLNKAVKRKGDAPIASSVVCRVKHDTLVCYLLSDVVNSC